MSGHFDLTHLCAIHSYLFQDVYDWAGALRTVDISRGASRFANFSLIESYLGPKLRGLAAENWLHPTWPPPDHKSATTRAAGGASGLCVRWRAWSVQPSRVRVAMPHQMPMAKRLPSSTSVPHTAAQRSADREPLLPGGLQRHAQLLLKDGTLSFCGRRLVCHCTQPRRYSSWSSMIRID